MTPLLKKLLPDAIVIGCFALISFIYFLPAVTEGRVLPGNDHTAAVGMSEENRTYEAASGEKSRWISSAFSGMPTYQISPSYSSSEVTKALTWIYKLGLPGYVGLVFIMLLGFYLMLRVFNFKVWMAALGAIIWAFSSYYFIIILAGHIWKFITLAYIPPTIAGFVLTYRGKYWLGGLLTAMFAAFQIASNHVQMSYYFLFVMGFLWFAFLYQAIKDKALPRFAKATGIVVVAATAAVLINISNLYHTYEYSKHTMREKSELIKANSANQTSSGLERDYITNWSYGTGETFSLMIPNVKGGASQLPLNFDDDVLNAGTPQLREYYSQPMLGQYWGEQPGTSGPVYVGAFVCLLFLLGCFLVKGPIKWALLGVTILSILLSWGHHFMWFTNLFIDHFPMYAKFRTVSSILVIAEFTIPLLAIMGLNEWLKRSRTPEGTLNPHVQKKLYIGLGITGGLCLLFALFPSMIEFNVSTTVGRFGRQYANYMPAEMLTAMMGDLSRMLPMQYEKILSADAWRSLGIILAGSALLWLNAKGKLKPTATVICILALCLIDMWSVNKRYLNDKSFIVPEQAREVVMTPADEQILQDNDLNYRVLDLSVNTFNDNATSYFHKSIGGYHPAKLRRYQELIEYHIQPEMSYLYSRLASTSGDLGLIDADSLAVLNMLNMRYVIVGSGGERIPLHNPNAYGNAWFAQDVHFVTTANEEIESLYTHSPRHTAIISELHGKNVTISDSTATIKLVEYAPNRLVYESQSATGGVAVFSEVYYPEWTVSIDGSEPSEDAIFPVNYVLRGVQIPAGKHRIEFRFDPQSVYTTERLAYVGFAILAAFALVFGWSKRKRKDI